MSKRKFAFMLMDSYYTSKHQAYFETEDMHTYIVTVNNPEEAIVKAKELAASGVGAIEVCGAFGAELAGRIIEATENKIPIGYVAFFPSQNEIVQRFWGEE